MPDHSRVLAAIDLGSNSFHMLIARVDDGHLRILDRLREPVRLAEGLNADRQLSPEVEARALACLERFGQRLREFDSNDVRAVGTNTLRAAHSVSGFLDRAEDAIGHPIAIISGIEEARLIFLGVGKTLACNGQQRLVMDIGGGSTELIIGSGMEPTRLTSLYLGCVNQSRQWFADGSVSSKAMKKAETRAKQEIETVFEQYRALGWDEAVGASGTIRAIAKISFQNDWAEEGTVTRQSVNKLKKRLVELGSFSYKEIPGLSEDRAPVIAGGVAILSALFQMLDLEIVRVAEGSLREGLIHDQLGRLRHEDVRDKTVQAYINRTQVDTQQANRVQDTALALLEQVKEDWSLADEEPTRLLTWAAQLHEVGRTIAFDHYHKHGAYMLRSSVMAGFSQQEQAAIAALVRTHRRKFSTGEFETLPKRYNKQTTRLAILLRLSFTLNRSRSTEPLPPLQCGAKKKRIELGLPADWLEEHPLTLADLEEEKEVLEKTGFELILNNI